MEEIRLYDFKKSEKFSIENLRHLITMSEEFCKSSNMQITYEVKNEDFKMSVDNSCQITYGEFIEMVDNNSLIVEYNINPLVENLTLFMDKPTVLSLVDLLLGGNGKIESLDRELTNIDLELLRYLVENLLKRICVPYEHEDISIVKIYTNTAQYQKLKNKDIVFNSLINAHLEGSIIGNMELCIPYISMAPIVNNLVNNKIKDIKDDDTHNKFASEIFEYTKNVDIDICAKLGSAKVSINDLLNLEEGDVILLEQKISDDIIVNVGDAEIYKAKPGALGIKKGIEITEIINGER